MLAIINSFITWPAARNSKGGHQSREKNIVVNSVNGGGEVKENKSRYLWLIYGKE
jgi:hypothetical protein